MDSKKKGYRYDNTPQRPLYSKMNGGRPKRSKNENYLGKAQIDLRFIATTEADSNFLMAQ